MRSGHAAGVHSLTVTTAAAMTTEIAGIKICRYNRQIARVRRIGSTFKVYVVRVHQLVDQKEETPSSYDGVFSALM